MPDYKVVFHVDEMSRWKVVLVNVANLVKAIEKEEYHIEVLANAEAVKYFDFSKNLDADIYTLGMLNEKGVDFVACNNALEANNMTKDNLPSYVKVVPAGVVELIEKQKEGYAYIRP